MLTYSSLETEPRSVQRRTALRLMRLREQLDAEVPARTVEDTLLVATWNIREFDSTKYGARTAESFFYIAEIISRFDLVAVQEVRADLRALDRLKSILGPWWKSIATDVTEGSAGNGERMAFLYDTRKVEFACVAGEIVLPDKRTKAGEERALQFARSPFLCSFEAGWSTFNLCTVHIYYGQAKATDPRRVQEIHDLAQLLAKRARQKSPLGDAENLILLGDFNIFNRGDATMTALEQAGFLVPEGLRDGAGTNLDRKRHYDQIAIYPRGERFHATGRAGVFDFTRALFRDEDERTYAKLMGEDYAKKKNPKQRTTYYKQWRQHQMSDHLVLWAELDIGWTDEHLAQRATARPARP